MDQKLIGNRRGARLSFRTVAVPALAAASLALNIYLLFFRLPALEQAAAGGGALVDPVAVPGEGNALNSTQGEGATTVTGEAAAPKVAEPQVDPWVGYQHLSLSVKGSIARTFNQALGAEEGDLVSAFYSRIFMWDLDLKSDVRAGDKLTLLYRIGEDRQVEIAAATYRSSKHNRTYRAYHFQQDGRPYPHFYSEDGKEVAARLFHSPLADYEQVTSLLKDRPTHKGIDFKAPVGTDVLAPHAGRIGRVNWGSFKYNGNCVELIFDNGNIAKFLHLDKLPDTTKPGLRVKAGEAFATSGNTGRSTAPHLHYQVETPKGRIIDPFESEKTTHLQLPKAEMPTFLEKVSELDKRLAMGG